MPTPPKPGIREVLLTVIQQQSHPRSSGSLQQFTVLEAAAKQLGLQYGNKEMEEAVLTEWNDLFRTGLLGWGLDITNPNPPFFHLSARGRTALAAVTRDPSNPDGYLRHVASLTVLNPITDSYLTEGVQCYVAGLHKAAAVMVGAAFESVILDLRDAGIARLTALGKQVPKALEDWRIKTVQDALAQMFDGIDAAKDRALRERYDSNWAVFSHQIRVARNDAGHPTSIDPVTADSVHASLLVFPELAKLATMLRDWIRQSLV
jgi:hypothetical protein